MELDNDNEGFYPVYIHREELNALLNRDMSDKEWEMLLEDVITTLDLAVEQVLENVVNRYKTYSEKAKRK